MSKIWALLQRSGRRKTQMSVVRNEALWKPVQVHYATKLLLSHRFLMSFRELHTALQQDSRHCLNRPGVHHWWPIWFASGGRQGGTHKEEPHCMTRFQE